MERGAWKSNFGFIIAAIGSAVGLGNIWRFSYLCHKNGGGTFLIPYLIALVTVGIPIMILEFGIGHKMKGSAPASMRKVNAKWEWLGWWPVIFVMFGINLYYVVVIAWCALYMLFSLKDTFPWEGDTAAFFLKDFLGKSETVTDIGIASVRPQILIMTIVIWFVLWLICARRIDKGIEVACKIFMPILFLLTCVLVFWGLQLDGAGEGLKQYMKPDWSKLGEIQVWRDAFGQIFFTLSIGFGIMIAYASYLPRKANLVKSAFITSIVNCSYSVFAGTAVFCVLGYMAKAKGVPVDEVVDGGPGLCFVIYPEAISLLPGPNNLFGFLFFLTLVLAGITSAISIVEAFVAAVIDKFGWNRISVVSVSCLVGLLGSVIFTTKSGLLWLDIVDHFLNNYGLVTVGLLECVLITWYYKIDKMHFHLSDANEGAYPKSWDTWWELTITYIAPIVLTIMIAWGIIDELKTPYEGYSPESLISIGLGVIVLTFLASIFFSVLTKHRNSNGLDTQSENNE